MSSSQKPHLGRRQFLITGTWAAGGLLVGCSPPLPESRLGRPEDFPAEGGQVALNGWVKITPDHRVLVATPRSEMGQGVHTALAMLVAEELDADWDQVGTEPAPIAQMYANAAVMLNMSPMLPDDDSVLARLAQGTLQRVGYALSLQVTGGSSSVRDAWEPMRLAGAMARALLVQAAAARWQVPVGEISVKQGVVAHPFTGQQARLGDLASTAAGLAPPLGVGFKPAEQWALIGKPVLRNDLHTKVNGQAVFGIDVRPPGLLYATVAQCPVFGGRVKSFDPTPARHMRGVKQVFQLGDSTVAVVADSYWRAKQALLATPVVWDEGPHAQLNSAQISAQLKADLQGAAATSFRRVGDVAQGLARGNRRLEAWYEAPLLAHAALEPINCTAQFKDGQLTVWNSTQVPSLARWKAAQVAGVPSDAVSFHVPYLGGGFGRRLETDMVEQAVAIALKTDGRPVKLVWSREEDFQHDMYRPPAMAHFVASLDERGWPLAWQNRVAAPSIGLHTMQRLLPRLAQDSPDKNQIEGAFDLPYRVPHLSVAQVRTALPVPMGSWRSVGHSYNAFFTECFMDELAQAAGQDPLGYRLALLDQHPRHRAVLALAADKAGWGQPVAPGRALGLALHESFGSICAQVAEVSVGPDGPLVHRVVCALDCGVVVNPDTVEAQVQGSIVFGLSAAQWGEITLNQGRVEQSNFPSQPVLTLAQMPVVETYLVPSARAPGGVGEPATPPIAPAVANALARLTGQRLRRLPLRLNGAKASA